MKTLDEVIKAWSICFSDNSRSDCTECPYADEDGEAACFNHDRVDALHYLKELKRISARLEKIALGNITETLEKLDNPALTWEQLKKMEGKPVWIEEYDPIDEKTGWHTASWKLIEFINDEYFDVRDSDGEQKCYYKSENDCYCWQAYRKERE